MRILQLPIRVTAVLVALAASFACGGSGANPEKEPPIEVYKLRGEVVRLVPADMIAVIKHEEIEGWMAAMTMEFPVKDKIEFEKLAVGAQIEAKLQVQDLEYWLTEIRVISPDSVEEQDG